MKLRTKFSILTISLTVAVVAGVSIAFYMAQKNLLAREIELSQINTVMGLVQIGQESTITANEILAINYLKQIKKNPAISFAMLTDNNSEIISHTDIDMLGKDSKELVPIESNFEENTSFHNINYDNKSLRLAIHPLIINEAPAGIAWVAFSRKYIQEQISLSMTKTKKMIMGVAVIGLAIGLFGAIFLSSTLTGPINKMAKGAESIGMGNLHTKIEVKTKDEIGSLARVLNRMAEQLAELDQMKQDFVSSITHEFRSPLNAMGIHFDLLFKGHLGELNQQQKESLSVLKNNSSRLALFIDDLLDMAKIESGKMTINCSVFNIKEIIEEIRSFYKVQGDQKKITLKTDIDHNLTNVFSDPDRIRQVITNLLNNAIKFTPENGTITISAKKFDSDFAVVSIKDTGMGINKEEQDSIFNKFEQVKGIREKVIGQKGTGLGLAIVKGIVEGQKGKIWLDSEPGKGSCFYFTVPFTAI